MVYFDQALAALDHLPESRVRTEHAIDLRLEMRNALLLLGDQARIVGTLREVETLTDALGDQRRLGQAQSYLANCLWLLGRHSEALPVVQRGLSVATALGDAALLIPTNFRLGLIYQSLGNYREALDCLRKSITSVEEDLAHDRFGRTVLTSVSSRAWLGSCLAERGEFAGGLALAQEAVHIAEAADHPASLVEAYWKAGAVHLQLGELHQAVRELQQALAIGRSSHIRLLSPWAASALGYAYALSGHIQEALELLAEAAEHAVSMNLLVYQSISIAWHGEAMLLAGRGTEARQLAMRALDLSHDRKERGHEAWTLRLLAEIALDGPPGEAFENYDRARMLADELGMRPLVAHCHLGLGKLYRRTDKREQARERLVAAAAMYREMGMTYWLEKAEAEITESGR